MGWWRGYFGGVGSVRTAAVAGLFYPGLRRTLEATVDGMRLGAVRRAGRPKALVVPHAGYIYSVPITASAYAQLREPFPMWVVLLGPAHFEPVLDTLEYLVQGPRFGWR